MKTKIFVTFLLLGLFAGSCDNYLKEEMVSGVTYSYYTTEKGITDGLNAAYPQLKEFYGHERGMTMAELGTDEYMNGSDGSYKHYNYYTTALNSFDTWVNDLWTQYYQGINICNNVIDNIPNVKFVNASTQDIRLGEAYFLRAMFYFGLVQQFGSIPLKIKATTSPEREFKRSPVTDIYKQLVSDLRLAESKLPASQSEYGRATKGAAQHLLSLVYLTRTSAETEIRGAQPNDLDSAIFYSEAVVNSGKYALEPDFSTFYNFYILNKADNPNSKEVIFSVQNCLDPLLRGNGNQNHLFFLMEYDTKPGMLRDIANGRPWKRLMPTDYTINGYNRKIDSRFYKEFKMAYYSNNANTIPKDGAGKPKFKLGDTAIYVTLQKDIPNAVATSKSYTWYPKSILKDDGSGYVRDSYSEKEFPALIKFLDPHRETIVVQEGGRDFPVYRYSETLLIAAEAYGRKGDYTKAAEYINIVRKRAAYKAGEAKPKEFLTVEGGDPANLTVSTENDMLITETDINSADKLVNFILDERTRELLGENHRWFDLVRCGKLYERVKAYNPKASGIAEYHKLRPIPQAVHIDRLVNAGPLSEEQNPGYY
jgi:starch-binding outer membrane protein, SusD/RagB family